MIDTINEDWKPIKGYENLYMISNLGRVKTTGRIFYQRHYSGCMARHEIKEKIIKPHFRPNGYVAIGLTDTDGKQTGYMIHRLVAEHFVEKPEGKNYVNHLDSNPQNNRADNLEWCTQSENIQYAYDQGRKIPPHMRKIEQYDANGDFVKLWNSQAEIERELGIYQANIYKVCSGKRQTAGGYIWKYAE